MKKLLLSMTATALFASLPFSVLNASAAENTTNSTLVAPVENPEKLSDSQQESKLGKMGYTEQEIDNMGEVVKEELLENGGEKADIVKAEWTHTYTSLDGKKYEVTEENQDEIDKIRRNDAMQYNLQNPDNKITVPSTVNQAPASQKSSGVTTMASKMYQDEMVSDKKLQLFMYLNKTGKVGKEHTYYLAMDAIWVKRPVNYYTDEAGLSWDTKATGVASKNTKYFDIGTDDGRYVNMNDRIKLKNEVYGVKAEINLGLYTFMQAGFSTQLRVPDKYNGETARVVGKYVHAFSVLDIGLGIGVGSITVPGSNLTDDWSLAISYKVGS